MEVLSQAPTRYQRMGTPTNLTYWIGQLQAGPDHGNTAALRLWEACAARLIGMARDRLANIPRLRNEAEAVALRAFESFILRAKDGRFPRLNDRNDLFALLMKIASCKVAQLIKQETNRSRRIQPITEELVNDILAREPDPAEEAAFTDTVVQILTQLDELGENWREVARLRLEGHRIQEIADGLGCCEATVRRRLEHIRRVWAVAFPEYYPPDDPPVS